MSDEKSKSEVESFLKLTKAKLDSYHEFQKIYAPQLAPGFRVLDVVRPDEMRLSSILAFLLNPNASHAQGEVFLKRFLEKFELTFNSGAETKVSTEAGINGGRLDVLLTFNEQSALAIENKPWAVDGEGQVSGYLKYLEEKHGKKYCLIYLSRKGEPPSEDSLFRKDQGTVKEGHLKLMSYPDLIPWLEECKALSKAERVRFFIDEFIRYIQCEFMEISDMDKNDVIVEMIVGKPEVGKPGYIPQAMAVAHAMEDVKKELLKKLESEIKDKIASKEWELEWDMSGKKHCGIMFKFNKDDPYKLAFNFDETGYKSFIYGITRIEGDKPIEQCNQICQTMESLSPFMGGDFYQDRSWWIWARQNIEFDWGKIANGSMASEIVEFAEEVDKALKKGA